MLKTTSSVTNAIGALNYKGVWNAATNNPTLTSGVGTKGDYYVVGTAGSTNLDGETLWTVGDWAVFNGTVWQKVAGGDAGLFTTIASGAYQWTSSAVVTETTTARTLSASDNGKIIYCTNTSPITVTTASGLGAGFSATIFQGSTGNVTIAAGLGTTLGSYSGLYVSQGQNARISLFAPVADQFVASGDIGSALLLE
jgi:hypothetical protein